MRGLGVAAGAALAPRLGALLVVDEVVVVVVAAAAGMVVGAAFGAGVALGVGVAFVAGAAVFAAGAPAVPGALLAVSAAIRSLIADSSSFMSNGLPAREPSGGGDGFERSGGRRVQQAVRRCPRRSGPAGPSGRLGQVLQRFHRVLDAADRVSHLEVEDGAGGAADGAHLLGQHAVDDVLHDCARIEQLSETTEI